MNRLPKIALVLAAALAFPFEAAQDKQEKFVQPKHPIAPKGAAPSPKVTNGTVFESGALELQKGQTLALPDNAVVETYKDGTKVRFFLTKTMRCSGHPPAPMHLDETRHHFGIAQRVEKDTVVVSTFGEWANRGGAARIRLLVLVPPGTKHERKKGLHGRKSAASSKMDFGSKALKRCYWYAGHRPKDGWKAIETDLNFNRFLQPR